MKKIDSATEYASRIIRGLEPHGPLVAGACQRHVAELKIQDTEGFPYIWNPAKLAHFQKFCLMLRQYKGEWKNLPLNLMGWQSFIIGSALCWVHKSTGLRRFRTVYVEVPRKNGKSALASALGLYMLMFDDEPGAEIYMLATKKEQAKIVYGDALKFLPFKLRSKYLRTRHLETYHDTTESKMVPLASNSTKLDGLNPHCAIADELHEWPSRLLWDVIEDGMGARRQPLMFGITTAGHNKHGIAMTLRNAAESLAKDAGRREYIHDGFFGYVACPAPEDIDKWDDPRVWAAANPCLGQAKRLDYMTEQCAAVKAMPSKLNAFLNKQLNVWTDAAQAWIPSAMWASAAVDGDELRASCLGARCYGGLDLARVSDLCAFSLIFPPEDGATGLESKWRVLTWHWCPEDKARKRHQTDMVPYMLWAEQGLITLTEGEATDYDHVYQDITKIISSYQVESIAFDRMFAVETVQRLQRDEVEMLAHGQGFVSMSPPTEEIERMILAGTIAHDGNPLMAWQMGNVVTIKDAAGSIKPDKSKSKDKIDGPVSMIMARGASLQVGESSEFEGAVAVSL